jgi:uncharacterized lipoprotein YddW (UPF0748 family)
MKRYFSGLLLVFQVTLVAQPVEAVRGVWLTNVDSDVLSSRENIVEALDFCQEIGLNAVFPVVWNKAMTQYPSEIMREFTGREIDTMFVGRDPLAELIEEAHKRDIKVIAWFEFGFAASFEEGGGVLLERKPEWAALDEDGDLVEKNGFEWMNSFHPEVRDFMISLVVEVATKYDVDGVQGDDRLPAAPAESGYDDGTVELYERVYDEEPPDCSTDYDWVAWRAEQLTKFMERLHDTVKAIDPNLIVSSAPSVYPWSMKEYLQDWPRWTNLGFVDLVVPQLYRQSLENYEEELDRALRYQIAPERKRTFYPGVLLKVGDYYASKELLRGIVEANRARGVQGEVYFFYEGLKKYPEFFKSLYEDRAVFPNLTN